MCAPAAADAALRDAILRRSSVARRWGRARTALASTFKEINVEFRRFELSEFCRQRLRL
jgi:hypothetical protein